MLACENAAHQQPFTILPRQSGNPATKHSTTTTTTTCYASDPWKPRKSCITTPNPIFSNRQTNITAFNESPKEFSLRPKSLAPTRKESPAQLPTWRKTPNVDEEILSSPTTYHFQYTTTHHASPYCSRTHTVQYSTPDDTTLQTITSTRLISTLRNKPFACLKNGRSRGGVQTLISPESSIDYN